MRLALGAGDTLLKLRFKPSGHRVAVAEGREKRLVETLQGRPGREIFGHRTVLDRDRHKGRKLSCARFIGLVRKGRLIGCDFGRRQLTLCAALTDHAYGQFRYPLAEIQPGHEALRGLAGAHRQEGVTRDYGRETLRLGRHQAQADKTAPVLAEQRDVP